MKERKNINTKTYKALLAQLLIMFAICVGSFALLSSYTIHPAYAAHDDDGALDDDDHVEQLELALNERWVPTHQNMTEQFVATMMHQVFIIGTFFDAKQQLETQRLIQSLSAQAHKDYHPSYQMCEFGTNIRGLAITDINRQQHALIFNKALFDREVGKRGSPSYFGVERDYDARAQQFLDMYCDERENNEALEPICSAASGLQTSRDIDFTRLWEEPHTLDIRFFDDELTEDEIDWIAFSRYIFSHNTLDYVSPALLNQNQSQNPYLNARSLHAMRSVARRSFSNLVAEKAKNIDDAQLPLKNIDYMHKILEQLGVPEEEWPIFVGDNPSYFAQMEILTQKLYQRPDFYTNLYDKPANVARIGASLQAIKLMQDRDRFEAALRREMLVSLLVETNLREEQTDTNRKLITALPNLTRGSE